MVSGKLICMLVVPVWVLTPLKFAVVTYLSGQRLTFDGACHFGGVWQARLMDNKCRRILLMPLSIQRDGPFILSAIHPRPTPHDTAQWRPSFGKICVQQPAHSANMSPIERVWDAGWADTTACSCSSAIQQRCTAIEEKPFHCRWICEMCCAPSEPNKQQVLALNVREGWVHGNDATPKAFWQVCSARAGPDLRAADAYRWQILTSARQALAWCVGGYHALPPDTCCVWGIFRCLKPDPDVHLQT